MQAKPQCYERARKRQAIYLTIAAGCFSAGLVVAMIMFCYQSSHLRM